MKMSNKNRLKRLEKRLKMVYGEKLPDRVIKEDGKLFVFYGNEKQEIQESKMIELIQEEMKKYHGNFDLVINKGEPPENERITIGHFEVSEDLKDIALVIDGKKVNKIEP